MVTIQLTKPLHRDKITQLNSSTWLEVKILIKESKGLNKNVPLCVHAQAVHFRWRSDGGTKDDE